MYKKEIFLEIDANLHQPIQSMEADSNSRAIRFYLTSNYAPLNLKDKKVIFKAVKPDSTDIVNDCEIIDVEKGIVETKVTKQLNAVPGRVNCQLSIIGANDYVLKTKKFGILVDSKLTESGIISSREYKTLENALSEVHEINKNFEQVNAKINEVATKGTTVEVIEEVTKEEIERQIADGTITHLMIEDGSVTPEKTSFYDEIATQKNLLKNAEFDYMGNNHNTVKKAIDSSIDWVLGEVNTAHHEGQHITATDTIEGHAKSAILKGQTLVNVAKQVHIVNNVSQPISDYITLVHTGNENYKSIRLTNNGLLKPNTKYLMIFDVAENTLSSKMQISKATNVCGFETINMYPINAGQTGIIKHIVTSKSDLTNVTDYLYLTSLFGENGDGTQYIKLRMMIIEYQEGAENWDIPYFDGMKSVQMPVLTTTGKNLFNLPLIQKQSYVVEFDANSVTIQNGDGRNISELFGLKHKPNEQCTFIYDVERISGSGDSLFAFYYTDGTVQIVNPKTVNVSSSSKTLEHISLSYSDLGVSKLSNICLVQGIDNELTYEPYKSNILTTDEEVELRGFGDVQDTLDLATGELTQRIDEVVLDGSENWRLNYEENSDLLTFTLNNFPSNIVEHRFENSSQYLLSDSLPITVDYKNNRGILSHCLGGNHWIVITVKRNELTSQDVAGFKQFLSSNPIKIQYRITESVKTVDLSDNHVYSYKDVTHYDCSSAEGSLVPTLSIDVPTNLPAVVTRQRVTIQELEKENVALKNEIEETVNSSVNGDLELMSSQFELDFRLFEIEMNLDMPMMAMMRGVKSMAMTVYQQAKTLILAGKYEREDMEYKLNRYKAAGRITVEEYDELIALMDARELVD